MSSSDGSIDSSTPPREPVTAEREKYKCIDPNELERFLLRRRASPHFPSEMSLAENLVEVLRKANEFVPSAAGSILLDNPTLKLSDRKRNELYFIAAFGVDSAGLLGHSIPADSGIAGHVYVSGCSYYSSDVTMDRHFYSGVDELTSYTTQSLVAIPIRIEKEVCGVLELINRRGASGYDQRDLDLLEIFAGYISVSIQNVLDARHAQEIAKRDNLTGLYNDRYLHIGLTRTIEQCEEREENLAVFFLDLDHFKNVNDNHGHLAGSQVLREIGYLMAKLNLYPEALTARYGGDEFVLAVPGLSLEEAQEFARTICREISEYTFLSEPGDIHPEPLELTGLTCSVGLAMLDEHLEGDLSVAESKSGLLRLADTAMYRAKSGGRNQIRLADPEEVEDDLPMSPGRSVPND